MKHRIVLIPLLFLTGPTVSTAQSGVELLLGTCYHKAVVGPQFGTLESTSAPDNGGLLYIFVENTGSDPDTVISVSATTGSGADVPIDAWRAWPRAVQPISTGNNVSSITIKSIDAGFAEGGIVNISIGFSSGATIQTTHQLSTPDLRLANAIPTQELDTLLVYFRNDGTTDYQLEGLSINEVDHGPSQMEILGGSDIIPSNRILIVKVWGYGPYQTNGPLAIRARFLEAGGADRYVSAGIRVVEPHFPIGSWNSSGLNPGNELGRARLRKVGVESLHGPGDPSNMADGWDKWHIGTIWEPGFGDPFSVDNAIPTVQAHSGSDHLHVWSVDDEPDLNGKPIDQVVAKSDVYWDNDPNTSSYVNLAVQKKMQRYGWYTDVVGMDHYAAPSAPNVIPNTWIPIIGRESEIEEALEYSEYLKFNTEPRRMWNWVQFAADTWDHQPHPVAVDYQFWAHVMAGAKGIEYFVAQTGTQDQFPELWENGVRLFKKFKSIRNLALYSEYADIITSDNPSIRSRALVGPDAIVVVVVNNSIDFSGNLLTGFETSWQDEQYTISFPFPAWVDAEEKWMLTEGGKDPNVNFNVVSGIASIQGTVGATSQVHVIGRSDQVAPEPPTGLNIAHQIDSANYILSWKEPYDDFGVRGYQIFYNDALIDTSYAPVYEVSSGLLNCSGHWRVKALDAARNIGPADSLWVEYYTGGASIVDISLSGQSGQYVNSGEATFHVTTVGTFGYQWQYSLDGLSDWTDFNNSMLGVIGANNDTLVLSYFETPGRFHVRCIIQDPCGENQISSSADAIAVFEGINFLRSPSLSLRPNPSDGRFWIEWVDAKGPIQWQLVDLAGREVMSGQQKGANGTALIDASLLDSGMYVMKLNTDGETFTKRVIIVHR